MKWKKNERVILACFVSKTEMNCFVFERDRERDREPARESQRDENFIAICH